MSTLTSCIAASSFMLMLVSTVTSSNSPPSSPFQQRDENESPQQSIESIISGKDTGELRMGDAILQKSQVDFLYKSRDYGDSVIPDEKYRWTNGVIPYVIDCSLERLSDAMASINAAIAEWEQKTCLRFVKRTNQKKFLTFFRSTHCWGHVGMIDGAHISVGAGCEFKHVMSHEIGHAVGFYHEHNRKDRDQHVEVLWRNIGSFTSAFEKTKNGVYHGTTYDMSSIMHYPWSAFSANGKDTLKPRVERRRRTSRPYKEVSKLDIEQTEKMYKCSALRAQRDKKINDRIMHEQMEPEPILDHPEEHLPSHQKVEKLMTQMNTIGKMVARAAVKPPGTKGCVDWSESCSAWKKAKYCETAEIVRKYCKLTCEVDACRKTRPSYTCPRGDSFPQCKEFAEDGLCCKGKYKEFMKDHCCQSCFQKTKPIRPVKPVKTTLPPTTTTTTTTTTTEPPIEPDDSGRFLGTGRLCVDLRTDCPSWASNGACKNNWANYMAKNCAKTCKNKGVKVACDEPGLKPPGECANPLGLSSDGTGRFKIPDRSFSSLRGHLSPGSGWQAGPENARLYFTDDYKNKRIGSWCSATNDITRSTLQKLTVDLGEKKRITYIATQGRDKYFERVSQFKVEYSDDGRYFHTYSENGKEKLFQGNCDHVTPVLNHFMEPLEARYFRYVPWKWNYPCVRMELYGCGVHEKQPAPVNVPDTSHFLYDSMFGAPLRSPSADLCEVNPKREERVDCKDARINNWCEKQKARCKGYDPSWTDYMKKHCKRTCGYCG